MTPVEVIASAVCSGPRFGGGPAPCEVCRGRAVQDVAALTAQGYVIVRTEDIRGVLGPKRGVRAYIEAGRRLLDSAEHPAQPSGTLQDAKTSGDGTMGPLAHTDVSTDPSELRYRLYDAIPVRMVIWGDDDEVDQFPDWDLKRWMTALGHNRVHTACCDRCGCATTCIAGAFYDAVMTSVIRELDRIGALREPTPITEEKPNA